MAKNATSKDGSKGDGKATRFKKGNKGSISKGDVYPSFKKLTREELNNMANLLLWGNMDKLKQIMEDPNSSALAATISSVVMRIYEKGDMHSLDVLLNRMIGRVKETIQLAPLEEGAPTVQIVMPSNGREVIEAPK